ISERVRRGRPFISGISRTVDSAVNYRGFPADVLHDVDFSASRPTRGVNVFSQQPKRGPKPLPVRNPDTGFESAVLRGELILCNQTRRSVITRDIVSAGVFPLDGFNHERPA